MKVAVFNSHYYAREFYDQANRAANNPHELIYFETPLNSQTVILAEGYEAVSIFVNDQAGSDVLAVLARRGTKLIALRCAGYNNVDLKAAAELGIKVVRVPAYSPYAVAEHAVGLILMLNRKLHKAYNRVRDDNFTLDGLLGFDLYGCTVGVIGTGKIGLILAKILNGFGCHLLGYDAYPNDAFTELGDARYVELPELFAQSDIISLHCPLLPETHYIINREAIAQMKTGVMLINTSRGQLIDTEAAIEGIKSKKIGYFGLDVYEQEDELFFADWSQDIIQDDTFQLLQSFPNVVITAHQGFFTRNALSAIAKTTIANLSEFERGDPLHNEIKQ
jgi:D-lactate dehydrogenase